jgi:hypothetical protein
MRLLALMRVLLTAAYRCVRRFDARDTRDPTLIQRISFSYDRRMGR